MYHAPASTHHVIHAARLYLKVRHLVLALLHARAYLAQNSINDAFHHLYYLTFAEGVYSVARTVNTYLQVFAQFGAIKNRILAHNPWSLLEKLAILPGC